MSKPKYLVVGRGIAGAMLSFRMMQRGLSHDIIDKPDLSASSKIAAGLMNPVVLKRLRLVKDAENFLKEAPAFYQHLEKELDSNFYHPTPIHHFFASAGEVNNWVERSEKPVFDQLLGPVIESTNPLLPAEHGLGVLENCGWLDTEKFLAAHRAAFVVKGSLMEADVSLSQLRQMRQEYQGIIICSGHLMRQMFREDESLVAVFTPTRGEVMTIYAKDLPEAAVLHGRVFIMPLGGHTFKVGATYHWDKLADISSQDGLEQLKAGLARLYKGSYEIIAHKGGVRPNIKDRKPILGELTEKGFFSFNGMGSRAVLMTPYLSNIFLQYLTEGQPLPDIYNLQRFLK